MRPGASPRSARELLDEFIRHLRVERGLSKNTHATYQYRIADYLNFLAAARSTPVSATREDILLHLETKKNAGCGTSALAGSCIAIRQFHRYLFSHGLTPSDPTIGMKLPKLKRRLPEPLTIAEMERLLGVAGIRFHQLRLRAGLELLYSTAMRISELLSLTFGQVDMREGWVRVMGKGSKERLVPIGPRAKEALRSYIAARNCRFADSGDALFVNSRGERLSRGGIKNRTFPHRIRHTAATHLLAGGAELRILQQLLGHSSIVSTQIYTHVDGSMVRKTCETAHPRF